MARKVPIPTDVLNNYLDEYHLTAQQLADGTQMSLSSVRALIYNKGKITLKIASRLAKFFGTTIEFWADLQTAFDIFELKGDKELQQVLSGITKAKKGKAPPAPVAKKASKSEPAAKRGSKADSSTRKQSTKASDTPAKRAGRPSSKAATKPEVAAKGRKPATSSRKAASEPVPAPKRASRTASAKKEVVETTIPVKKPRRARKPKETPVKDTYPQQAEEETKKPNVILIKKRAPKPAPQTEEDLGQQIEEQQPEISQEPIQSEPDGSGELF